MKVVILCGGKGTRLKEETEFRPKPLVRIGEMPIIWHIMKIYSYYGYKDFIVCLGYKGEMIREYFLNFEEMTNDFTLFLGTGKRSKKILHHHKRKPENWRITFVDTGQEAQTGTRVYRIRKFIQKGEDFFLTYGDGVADIDIKALYAHHKKMNKVLTVSGVHSLSVFGLIEHSKGLVKTFREKPKLEDVISGGFFVCNSRIFDYLADSDGCVFENKPMKKLAREKQLAFYKHEGFWYCMDTQKHADELNRLWVKGLAPWSIWDKNA